MRRAAAAAHPASSSAGGSTSRSKTVNIYVSTYIRGRPAERRSNAAFIFDLPLTRLAEASTLLLLLRCQAGCRPPTSHMRGSSPDSPPAPPNPHQAQVSHLAQNSHWFPTQCAEEPLPSSVNKASASSEVDERFHRICQILSRQIVGSAFCRKRPAMLCGNLHLFKTGQSCDLKTLKTRLVSRLAGEREKCYPPRHR